jgi:hypothetical protein
MAEIRKLLILSTGHVSKETADLLNGHNSTWPCVGGPYSEHGWFVYCHEEQGSLEVPRDFIPDDLFAVMTYAREKHGAHNVLLDCDGDRVDDLPYYEW